MPEADNGGCLESKFLSIVTISYNQRTYLRQAIESVLSQKEDDVEYIVVDPGSTDGSRNILAEYRDDIDVLVLDPDQGPADGLNRGFQRASGDIGYFLNSDDFLLPGAISRLRQAWYRNQEKDFMICSAWMVDAEGEPVRLLIAHPVTLDNLLAGHAVTIQQGLSFRVDSFRSIGGFNIENRASWDFELLCDLVAAGKVHNTSSERIGAFRFHSEGLTGDAVNTAHHESVLNNHNRICRKYDRPEVATLNSMPFNRAIKYPRIILNRILELSYPNIIKKRYRKDISK